MKPLNECSTDEIVEYLHLKHDAVIVATSDTTGEGNEVDADTVGRFFFRGGRYNCLGLAVAFKARLEREG